MTDLIEQDQLGFQLLLVEQVEGLLGDAII